VDAANIVVIYLSIATYSMKVVHMKPFVYVYVYSPMDSGPGNKLAGRWGRRR